MTYHQLGHFHVEMRLINDVILMVVRRRLDDGRKNLSALIAQILNVSKAIELTDYLQKV